MRAVIALAERTSGIVDHALSEAQYRNFKVLQTTGWVMTTLTEARNRADLFIIAGSDIHALHPRFFETIVCPPASMFDVEAPKRTVVFIGKGLDRSGAKGSRIGEVVSIPCDDARAGEVVALVRARLRGFRVKEPKLDGVTLAEIDALAERCRNAKYGVVVWAPPSLNFPHRRSRRRAVRGTIEGSQSDHPLRGTLARRRRRCHHRGAPCAPGSAAIRSA